MTDPPRSSATPDPRTPLLDSSHPPIVPLRLSEARRPPSSEELDLRGATLQSPFRTTPGDGPWSSFGDAGARALRLARVTRSLPSTPWTGRGRTPTWRSARELPPPSHSLERCGVGEPVAIRCDTDATHFVSC
jgi:hypothetical protein